MVGACEGTWQAVTSAKAAMAKPKHPEYEDFHFTLP